MLTYAYHCETCGTFEVQQKMSDATLNRCPTCGGPVRRLVSGGSGFVMKKPAGAPKLMDCGRPEGACCGCQGAGHTHSH